MLRELPFRVYIKEEDNLVKHALIDRRFLIRCRDSLSLVIPVGLRVW